MKYLMIILIILSTAIEAAGSKKVNPTELYEKAEKYLYIGDYNEALKVLKKYVRAEKKDPDGWSMYAFAHRKLEKYKQADRYYKKALQLDPNHKQALEYQGELFVELGDIDSAEQNLSLLKELCPKGCDELDMLEKYMDKTAKKSW